MPAPTDTGSDTGSDTRWLAVVPLDGRTPRPLTEVGGLDSFGARRVLLRRTAPAAPVPEAPTDAGPQTRSGAVDDGVPDEARARRR